MAMNQPQKKSDFSKEAAGVNPAVVDEIGYKEISGPTIRIYSLGRGIPSGPAEQ